MKTPMGKRYLLHIYRPGVSGAFISTLTDADFDFLPFKNTINAGLGMLTLQLVGSFDNFKEGDLIAFNNHVKLFCVDIDSGPNGVLLYDGFILNIRPGYQNLSEKVEVDCSSYYSKLARWLLHSGSNVILQTDATSTIIPASGVATAAAVEAVFKKAIDLYTSQATNAYLNYSASSVGTTGASMTYVFDKEMLDVSLNNILSAAPYGWYFYVGADNVIQFQPKPSSALHTFVFKKDFQDFDVQKNTDQLANNVVVQSAGTASILSHYVDSTSQGTFDDLWEVYNDSGIIDQTTADNAGNLQLAEDKSPRIKTTATILDNNLSSGRGYNIEIIQPGQTCKFRGFNDITSQTFNDNMVIVSVTYSPDNVVIELDERSDNIAIMIGEAIDAANSTTPTNGLVSYGTGKGPLITAVHEVSGAGAGAVFAAAGDAWTNVSGATLSLTTYFQSTVYINVKCAFQNNSVIASADTQVVYNGTISSTINPDFIPLTGIAYPTKGIVVLSGIPAGTETIQLQFRSGSTSTETSTNSGGCSFEIIDIQREE